MAQTVIVVIGQPRSVTNGVAKFIARLGANLGQRVIPDVNAWNTNWAEDVNTAACIVNVLGLDSTTGLPNPTRPTSPDPTAVANLRTDIATRAALASPSPFVLVAPTAILTDIRAALTGSNFIVVNLVRTTVDRIQSLQNAYSGSLAADPMYLYAPTSAQLTTYIAACDAARTTALTQLATLGVTVFTINISDIIVTKATTLTTLAASLGVNVPSANDLAFINTVQISGDSV